MKTAYILFLVITAILAVAGGARVAYMGKVRDNGLILKPRVAMLLGGVMVVLGGFVATCAYWAKTGAMYVPF